MRSNLAARCRIAFVLLIVAGRGNKSKSTPESGNPANPPSSANSSPSSSTLNQSSSAADTAQTPAAPALAPTPPPPPPPVVNSNVVLPAGAKASGTIVSAQSAGKFNGHALLPLTLDALRLNGTRFSIQTSEFEEVGKGRGKRTGIGAGGGAGAAGAGFTGKKDIVLPAETRLHFKLAQPVSIAVSQ